MDAVLHYKMSKAAEIAHVVKHGKLPPKDSGYSTQPYVLSVSDAEFSALTEAQRAIILAHGSVGASASAYLPQANKAAVHYSGRPELKADAPELETAPATVNEWLAEAQRIAAENEREQAAYDAALRLWLTETALPKAIDRLNAATAQFAEDRFAYDAKDIADARRLNLDISEFENALDAYEEAGRVRTQRRQEAEAEAERRKAAAAAAAEAAKAERHAEKVRWANEHGSDRLRRAVERSHDCTALYVRERAALEAPGYTADIYDNAEWKDATCPSAEALDEADAAEKGLGYAKIVWLTSPAADTKGGTEYGDGYGWKACEAVVVSDYLGKYDLIKEM